MEARLPLQREQRVTGQEGSERVGCPESRTGPLGWNVHRAG